jgi:hypothetical protein
MNGFGRLESLDDSPDCGSSTLSSKDLSLTRLVPFSFRGLRSKFFTPSIVALQDLVFVS